MKVPALFLDRDGVINIDKTYVYKFSDIEWMPGIFELIQWANKKNWKVIVLTNQSGIGRGYYTIEDVELLHSQMNEYLLKNNAHVDDWLYSDSLTDVRRKPSPSMMLEAAEKYNIDLEKSVMIGDKISDLIELKGPEYLLVQGKYSLEDAPSEIKIFDTHSEVLKYLAKIREKL